MATERFKLTKKLAFTAVLSALAVVILYLGAILDILDLSAAAIASLCVLFLLCELGTRFALAGYAVISTLSLLLLPTKTGAIVFTAFLGYYPVAKYWFEKKLPRPLSWVCKFALLNASVCLMLLLVRYVMVDPLWLEITTLVGCNLAFLLLDILMDRLLVLYVRLWRKKLHIRF